VARVQSGETTAADISRRPDIQPTVIRRWIQLSERGRTTAVQAGEVVVAIH